MKKIIKTFILIVVFSICLINFTSCKTNKDITITLYPNNGDETKVIKAKANEKIQLPEIPQTEGYFFVGWFLDQQFKQKVGFPATFKEDVVLYGGWQTLVQYELDEETDTYQVTGVVFSHYNITILETYHGKKVTAIKEEAFKDNGTIMNIKLPDTIKTIGDRAFMNMRCLMNINLPDGLEEIGNDIFSSGISICLFNKLSDNISPVISAISFLSFKSSTSSLYISNSNALLPLIKLQSIIYNPIKTTKEIIHTKFVKTLCPLSTISKFFLH